MIQRDFYNESIRLREDQLTDPESVLDEFFVDYQMVEVRQQLWDLLETALTSENTAFAEAPQREALLLFYYRLEEVMEAVFIKYFQRNHRKLFGKGLKTKKITVRGRH